VSSKRAWPEYQRRCGWNALLAERENIQELRGKQSADVIVIGAGYTGLAAARRAAELAPETRIIVLDASTIGEGNPGRNSGFLLEISLANDADPQAVERMAACNGLIAGAMQGIVHLVQEYDIDCDLVRTGTYRAAAGETGIGALHRYRAFLDAANLPYEVLTQDDIGARLGTRFYREGLYSPHCYLVQPAALARGLADALPGGVSLFENSPATAIHRRNYKWNVQTPEGSVSAPLLLVANNAFCTRLGIGRTRIAAIYTYAGLTDPLRPAALEELGSDANWGLLPAHRLGSTLRRTADGRLLIRSMYGYETEADNEAIAGKLEALLRQRFPQVPGLDIARIWSGATGYTLHGGPLWGRLERGLFVAAGCNGGGVVKGTLFGRLLADLAFGGDVPDVAALFGRAAWMPPEPFRKIGFRIVSALERCSGKAEV
jgi:glycine/D-amino acid oxidase-like deaminating enzyme